MSYDEKRDKLDELERLAKEAGFETLRLIGWNALLRLTIGNQVAWLEDALTELEQKRGRLAAISLGTFMPRDDPALKTTFRELFAAQRRYINAVEAARDQVKAERAKR